MVAQRLAPDAILSLTNLSGTVSAIQDDPDAPTASWLTCPDNTANTSVTVSFPSPAGTLTGQQNARVLVRPTSAGSNAGTASVDVMVGGVTVASSSTVTVSAQQVIPVTFDASLVTDATALEVRVNGTSAGGKASNRKSVEVGAIEVNAEYQSAPAGVSGTSAVSAMAPRAAGTAIGAFRGSGAVAGLAPTASADATALLNVTGSASASAAVPTASGSGDVTAQGISGSVSASVPAPTVSATATHVLAGAGGTVSVTTAKAQSEATGTVRFIGTGDSSVLGPEASGDGGVLIPAGPITGTGDVTVATPTVSIAALSLSEGEEGPPWVSHGVIHLGKEPRH